MRRDVRVDGRQSSTGQGAGSQSFPEPRGLSDNRPVAVPPRFWRGCSSMKRMLIALAALAIAVPGGAADKKVEEAVAKAEGQIAKGRTEEAEKTMEKLVLQVPTAEAHAARARIQLKAGNVEGAAASAAEAVKQSASAPPEMKADALSTLAQLDLERGSGKDALAHADEAVKVAPTAANLAVLARAQARTGDA